MPQRSAAWSLERRGVLVKLPTVLFLISACLKPASGDQDNWYKLQVKKLVDMFSIVEQGLCFMLPEA